jgi:hypothetical protein
MYAKNAVLLPTVSDMPRTVKYRLGDYALINTLTTFSRRSTQEKILDSNFLIGTN